MYVHWLDEILAEHEPLVGGKAASLARLRRLGLPVPDGFCISVLAYETLAGSVGVDERAHRLLAGLDVDDLREISSISCRFREPILSAQVPPPVALEASDAYREMGERVGEAAPAVAVRSSATAEDMPDTSFAGQHDSYLGIQGDRALLEHVKRCWASAWNAGSIHYRQARGIDHRGVLMAVVVQHMVRAEAAGVVFTANPVSGDRSEALVNSSWGLGESVVSGLVEADTFVVDKASSSIKARTIGIKETSVEPTDGRGTREVGVPEGLRDAQSLSDRRVAELVGLSRAVEKAYGAPQDIEWAYDGDRFHILQARPITTLGAG
jgi:pyruvate,water dikinase